MNTVPDGSRYDASDQDSVPETAGQMECLKPWWQTHREKMSQEEE